jgi:hypothetical protein
MATRQIKREEWPDFFDSFSRQHDGWLVTLEITGAEMGSQIQGQLFRLRGITQDADRSAVFVALGTPAREHLTHVISRPTRVWLQETSEGVDAGLQIESADAIRTLIRFRSAVHPELVDGVTP